MRLRTERGAHPDLAPSPRHGHRHERVHAGGGGGLAGGPVALEWSPLPGSPGSHVGVAELADALG